MAFDPKCLALASHFLGDDETVTPELGIKLAQHIQDSVEAWIEGEIDKRTYEPPV